MHGPRRIAGKLLVDWYTLIPRVPQNWVVGAALIAGLKITQRRRLNQFDGHAYDADKRAENEDWYNSDFSA